MNQNLPGVPNVPYHNYSHSPRRDYYPPPHHHPHQYPYAYHHPGHYQPPPPHQYQQQHWANPYSYYTANQSHFPRHYQPQSPLVVSSYPSSTNQIPVPRQLPQPFQPSRAPHDGLPTPPTSSHPGLSSTSTTPSNTDLAAPRPQAVPDTSAPPGTTSLDPPPSTERMPFYPPLPWYSVDESSFPPKAPRRRRKRRAPQAEGVLELPRRGLPPELGSHADGNGKAVDIQNDKTAMPEERTVMRSTSDQTSGTIQSSLESLQIDSTSPDSTIQTHVQPALNGSSSQKRAAPKPVVPVVPIAPSKSQRETSPTDSSKDQLDHGDKTPTASSAQISEEAITESKVKPEETVSKPVAKSWAELLRSKSAAGPGASSGAASNGVIGNGASAFRTESSADVIRNYSVGDKTGASFLEPRGLVNTGNMCYMNSILQVLVFCAPFYAFLEEMGHRAVHSFKSETPLIEALILFMREFSVINSATSMEQLRLRLKDGELEQYGEPFTPEFVYEVIRKLPRFSAMRRGHQQDAEEFLGFLLQGLHDECAQIMNKASLNENSADGSASSRRASDANSSEAQAADGGWLEVGPKQKPSVTRSSGEITAESPITKIFGGKLRSEFRVPGMKNSVTLEPYQPLQLDIGEPSVSNILDALKGLTRPETIHGNFQSPRGPGTNAVKQVFIETLPPVLILHLKRFQYDNAGGTQKIWKKVGYPLELEIPKEVFAQNKRNQYSLRPGGLPKYRLISVVYHHGKSASGGHYTVDVRRQEGGEWVRLDDTVIRRVRSEDVAKEGGEEDPKILAAALESHKREQSSSNNIYSDAGLEGMNFEESDDQGQWNKVNGRPTSPKTSDNRKWSTINGTAGSNTPSTAGKGTPRDAKSSVKDNKIAYILFYQQI